MGAVAQKDRPFQKTIKRKLQTAESGILIKLRLFLLFIIVVGMVARFWWMLFHSFLVLGCSYCLGVNYDHLSYF